MSDVAIERPFEQRRTGLAALCRIDVKSGRAGEHCACGCGQVEGRLAAEALFLAGAAAREADRIAAEAETERAVVVVIVEAARAESSAIARSAASWTIVAQSLCGDGVCSIWTGGEAGSAVEEGAGVALAAVGLVEAGLAGLRAGLAGEIFLVVEVEIGTGAVAGGGRCKQVVQGTASRTGIGKASGAESACGITGKAQL